MLGTGSKTDGWGGPPEDWDDWSYEKQKQYFEEDRIIPYSSFSRDHRDDIIDRVRVTIVDILENTTTDLRQRMFLNKALKELSGELL